MTQKPRFSKPIRKQTMADQLAGSIRESILAGEWTAGEALPTEPELSELFGVSRAVVRDATRMLVAQGLVEAQHGRGVFVTESGAEAFGEALLLALRRTGASVWDVEHFEQLFYPQVMAEVAREATEEEIASLKEAVETHIEEIGAIIRENWETDELPPAEQERLLSSYRSLLARFFAATHNQVIQLVGSSLIQLRSLRNWQDAEASADDVLGYEAAFWRITVEAISSRDPDQARERIEGLLRLPDAAETAMRQTPIGQIPVIPVQHRPDRRGDDR